MKAAFIQRTGDPDVIEYGDLPDPSPGPGQVLVRVEAVSVNPIDTYIRGGLVAVDLSAPYTIGCDLAGRVEACGEGATRFSVGQRAWGSNQGLLGRPGTFSELAVVDEQWLYPVPEGVGSDVMAAGALVGLTAHLGLFLHCGVGEGDLVFVNGGTGGVGAAVVQLATAVGARVVATVGSAEKQAVCEGLGAALVLDYHDAGMDDTLQDFVAENGGIDVWFETLREPTPERTFALMAKRGRVVLMAGRAARPEFPVGDFYTRDLRMFGFAMFNASAEEQQVCGQAISELAAAGGWHPPIGRTFPLSEAAAAHQLQHDNTIEQHGTLTGKIVLTP
ncbi:MAG: quinone oxidoreductase [Planctomyces sp.]|jgi:NADPH2:quinone reductase|nr:quinone oxidoreductase [Planctomyces sp.]MDP7274599.1 NADPH:quinone reductase [Planctomycetaceae bacterium]